MLSLILAVFLSIRKMAGRVIYDGGSPMFFQSDSWKGIQVKSGEEWVKSCRELFTPVNRPVYRCLQGKGEEWRVFPCLLPHNIYRSGLWYDNPFAWFCEPSLRMIWSSCIFLRCLRMALLLMFKVLAISREVIDKNALLFVFWEEYFDFARKNGG